MLRTLIRVAIALTILIATPAMSQKRLALLIGNQDYAPAVGRLQNPTNDVALVAEALQKVGFQKDAIRIVHNADRVAMLDAVDRYVDDLSAAGGDAVGFFYYSGHGVANKRDKRNYLIPVGVNSLDRRVWFKAIALDDIVLKLSQLASNAAHFVVFDACRNLLNSPTRGGKGFLPVDTRRGMLIAFSTDPGETASDEGARSGPYAAALATELTKPGQDHLDLFQNVKEKVYSTTRVQVPWTRDGMLQRIYLGGEEVPLPLPKPAGPSSEQRAELALWNSVKNSQDMAALQTYLAQYPSGSFSRLARVMVDRLTEIEAARQRALAKQQELRKAQRAKRLAEERRREARIQAAKAKHLAALRNARREAEDARKAIERARQQRLAALKAAEEANAARKKAEQNAQKASHLKLAALAPERRPEARQAPAAEKQNPLDWAKRAQAELRRHRCLAGPVDGLWGRGSQRSMAKFNRYAKLQLPTATVTPDGLAMLQRLKKPVCPVVRAKPKRTNSSTATVRRANSRGSVRKTARRGKKCRRETRSECTRNRGYGQRRDVVCAVSELKLICK